MICEVKEEYLFLTLWMHVRNTNIPILLTDAEIAPSNRITPQQGRYQSFLVGCDIILRQIELYEQPIFCLLAVARVFLSVLCGTPF